MIIVKYQKGSFYNTNDGDCFIHAFENLDQALVLRGECAPYVYNCNNLEVYLQTEPASGGVFSHNLTQYIRTILCSEKKVIDLPKFPATIEDLYKYLTVQGSNSYDFLAIENLWSQMSYLAKKPIELYFDEVDEFFKDKINEGVYEDYNNKELCIIEDRVLDAYLKLNKIYFSIKTKIRKNNGYLLINNKKYDVNNFKVEKNVASNKLFNIVKLEIGADNKTIAYYEYDECLYEETFINKQRVIKKYNPYTL